MDGSARAGALSFRAGRFICQSTQTTAGVWTTQALFPYSQPNSPCGLGSLGLSPGNPAEAPPQLSFQEDILGVAWADPTQQG